MDNLRRFFKNPCPKNSLNYKTIIIVTYGRSGSTLLQGIINTIKGVLVRGENSAFCRGLYEAWRSLIIAKTCHANKINIKRPTCAWFGADQLNPDRFLHQCQTLIREQLIADHPSNVTCYGFKEIRYLNHLDDLPHYLDFLCQVMPECAVVFNMRSHDDVQTSMLRTIKNDLQEQNDSTQEKLLLADLQRADDIFRDYSSSHPNCYINYYEDLIQGSDKIKPLFDFLGAELNKNKIAETLNTIHSYDVHPDLKKTKSKS